MSDTDYDVVIVGGGFGGTVAARELTKQGEGKVLLVDRRGRSGYPPASTSGIAGRWLKEFGLEPKEDAVSAQLRSFRLYSPMKAKDAATGEMVNRSRVLKAAPGIASDSLGVVLDEPNFLGRLEAEATKGGLTAWHSAHIKGIRGGAGGNYLLEANVDGGTRRVTSKYVIAADGYNSLLGRQMGLTTELPEDSFHLGWEMTIPNRSGEPQDEIGMYLSRSEIPLGYVWSFPSTEGGRPMRRVGIGTPRSVKGPDGKTIATKTFFDRWLANHPEYTLPEGEKPHHVCGGIIPTYFPPRRVMSGGFLLTGDALRVCDSTTGGGIAPAIITGIAAARCVASELGGQDGGVRTYPRSIRFLLKEMRVRYVLKNLLYSLRDEELDRFIDLLADYPLPTAGEIDPFKERRRFTRYAIRHGVGLMSRLLYRGRMREALRPWF